MFIYVLTNLVNGKQYVGQATYSVAERWGGHVRESRRQRNSCPILHKAIRKYGAASFCVEFIDLRAENSQALLDLAERWLIDELASRIPHGYNVERGGRGGRRSQETIEKIAAKHRGMKRSAQARINMSVWQKGIKKHSEEAKRRISQAGKGRIGSPEMRAKLSAFFKGRPSPLRGRKRGPMSEGQKQKLRLAKLGLPRTDDAKMKTGVSMKAKWQEPEYRAKMLAVRAVQRRNNGRMPSGI